MAMSSVNAHASKQGLAEARSIIASCSHFGFCTATCPTYALTHDENESPRGRIELIRIMLDSAQPPTSRTVAHLDSCLSCLACVSTCAVKVDYMHLIDHARAHIERTYRRVWTDRLLRRLVAETVSNRHYLRVMLACGRFISRFSGVMPGRLRDLLRTIPRSVSRNQGDVKVGRYPAVGEKRYRVALLAGCAQRVLAPEINAAAVRLMNRLGCEVVIARNAECCGALNLHLGRTAEGQCAARKNIQAWMSEMRRGAFDAIVVTASGCGTAIKDYGHVFQDDPQYQESARQIAALTVDVSEFLDRIGFRAGAKGRRFKVAYHDACSLRNGQRITRQPRQLLRLAGYSVVDVPEAHFCCGSAGIYNLLQPATARQLGTRKAGHIESTGAAIMAVGNVGCIAQLARYSPIPVVHTVELLDWAAGGPMPPSLLGKELQELREVDAEVEAAGGALPGEVMVDDTGIAVW